MIVNVCVLYICVCTHECVWRDTLRDLTCAPVYTGAQVKSLSVSLQTHSCVHTHIYSTHTFTITLVFLHEYIRVAFFEVAIECHMIVKNFKHEGRLLLKSVVFIAKMQ